MFVCFCCVCVCVFILASEVLHSFALRYISNISYNIYLCLKWSTCSLLSNRYFSPLELCSSYSLCLEYPSHIYLSIGSFKAYSSFKAQLKFELLYKGFPDHRVRIMFSLLWTPALQTSIAVISKVWSLNQQYQYHISWRLVRKPNFGSLSRPTESEALGMVPSSLVFKQALYDSNAPCSLKTTSLMYSVFHYCFMICLISLPECKVSWVRANTMLSSSAS